MVMVRPIRAFPELTKRLTSCCFNEHNGWPGIIGALTHVIRNGLDKGCIGGYLLAMRWQR